MIKIRDLASIIEYTYLMTTAKELLLEDIIVNPIKGDNTSNKVVVINKDANIRITLKPKIIIDRRVDKYDFTIPNPHLFNNNLINPFQTRLITKRWNRFCINPYLLDKPNNDWDCIYYLFSQLGINDDSKKLYVFKEYELFKMKRTDVTNMRKLVRDAYYRDTTL